MYAGARVNAATRRTITEPRTVTGQRNPENNEPVRRRKARLPGIQRAYKARYKARGQALNGVVLLLHKVKASAAASGALSARYKQANEPLWAEGYEQGGEGDGGCQRWKVSYKPAIG